MKTNQNPHNKDKKTVMLFFFELGQFCVNPEAFFPGLVFFAASVVLYNAVVYSKFFAVTNCDKGRHVGKVGHAVAVRTL